MSLCPAARWLLRLAIVSFVAGAIASVLEVLASQMPYTPLDFGLLAQPVSQLRTTALTSGLVLVAVAWLWPMVEPFPRRTIWLGSLAVGLCVTLGSMAYGALTGMMGYQLFDPHEAGRWLAYTRLFGQLLFALTLLEFARRLFFSLQKAPSTPRETD